MPAYEDSDGGPGDRERDEGVPGSSPRLHGRTAADNEYYHFMNISRDASEAEIRQGHSAAHVCVVFLRVFPCLLQSRLPQAESTLPP